MKAAKQRHMIRADSQPPKQQAAGVAMMHAGRVLLLRRSGEGIWGLPGGGLEAGEIPIQAAIRECHEEIGFQPSGELKEVSRTDKYGADYTTFFAHHSDAAEPTLNYEHEAAAWVSLDSLHKYNLHPGVAETLGSQFRADAEDYESHFGRNPETETDVVNAIHAGELSSPQYFANLALFAIRITGTGVSMRIGKRDPKTGKKENDEYVLRKPELYLNDEFLARCNGLPVILEHPPKQALDSKEFSTRIIGTIVLPYILGNEVWGIAKIWDSPAAKIMAENQLSTSPCVVFADDDAGEKVGLDEGTHLLIEDKPKLLDHIAVVENGVWDKGSGPTGIKAIRADAQTTTERSNIMAESGAETGAKKDEGGDSLAKIMEKLDVLGADVAEMKGKISQLEAVEEKEVAVAAAKPDGASSMPAPEIAAPAAPAAAPDNAIPAEHIQKIEHRMDALEAASKPRAEEEEAKMADAQAKADSVYSAHGKRAPGSMMGETLLAYRQRLAIGMQAHSEKSKGVNLRTINDSAVLDVMEGQIYADAIAAAAKVEIPAGRLVRRTKTVAGGMQINEYEGDPAVWMNNHLAPAYSRVKH